MVTKVERRKPATSELAHIDSAAVDRIAQVAARAEAFEHLACLLVANSLLKGDIAKAQRSRSKHAAERILVLSGEMERLRITIEELLRRHGFHV